MKVQEKTNQIIRSGSMPRTECTIELNRTSFEILAKMYSNPIRAIMRELGTNALESHIRAGHDKPFDLHLPTALDPNFRIRDYGVSMSPETMYNVYSRYMSSDKRDTNEEGGYFGLGSKTPFCYTDTFLVTTFLDAIKREYILVLNEQGIPEINELGQSETLEENGVQVSFAVKDIDTNEFHKNVDCFSYFSIKPNIPNIPSIEYSQEGSDWGVHEGTPHIIMGNIAYPITDHYLFGDKASTLLSRLAVDIFVEIGEVKPVPSRESIEYTTETKQLIRKKIEEIIVELSKKYIEALDNTTTLWECMKKRHEFMTLLGNLATSFGISEYKRDGTSVIGYAKIETKVLHKRDYSDSVCRPKKTDRIYVENKIYLNDLEKGGFLRVRHDVIDKKLKTVYIVDKQELDELKQKYGFNDSFTRISSLSTPPRQKNTNGSSSTYQPFLVLKPDRPGISNYDWETRSIDIKNEDVVYVSIYRYRSEYNSFKIWRELLKPIGIDLPRIVGVKNQALSRFEKRPNCLEFAEWLKQQQFPPFDYKKYKSRKLVSSVINRHETLIRNTAGDTLFDRYVRQINSISYEVNQKITLWEMLDQYKIITIDKVEANQQLVNLGEEVQIKYDFLEHLNSWSYGTKLTQLIFKLVDLYELHN